MKIKQPLLRGAAIPLLALMAASNLSQAQEASPSDTSYEALPELKASEILRDDVLKGSRHQVREEVPTYSGANHFTLDSDFGVFETEGNEMLVRRIHEINAIARLKEVSRSEEYKDALVKAAKSPLAAARACHALSRK